VWQVPGKQDYGGAAMNYQAKSWGRGPLMGFRGCREFRHPSCEPTRDDVVVITLNRSAARKVADVRTYREVSEIAPAIDGDRHSIVLLDSLGALDR
jgi:hypothetical protein